MGFTTAVFIRRNTPELRKKLEELGYSHGKPECYTDDDDNKYDFIICYNGKFYLLSQNNHVIRNGHPLKKYGSINCETNEELFLAIAALRDDTDENQWFVADSPLSVSYDDIVGNDHYFTEPKGSVFFWDMNWMHATIISGNYHKANVAELIEHFKEKEESMDDIKLSLRQIRIMKNAIRFYRNRIKKNRYEAYCNMFITNFDKDWEELIKIGFANKKTFGLEKTVMYFVTETGMKYLEILFECTIIEKE